jgi:molybdenum cofactor cytidylyltransferase
MGCVAGIILAAGKSSRMGKMKLLLDVHGKPMLGHVVESALHSALDEVIVVLGSEHELILESIDFKGATVVFNPEFHKGQSTSLKAGIAAVGESCDAALFLLGDLPLVGPGVIDAVLQKRKATRASIVVPVFGGKRGNPVLLERSLFPMVLALEGDIGAREILTAHEDLIETVDVEHDGILLDVDTWEDYLSRFKPRMGERSAVKD